MLDLPKFNSSGMCHNVSSVVGNAHLILGASRLGARSLKSGSWRLFRERTGEHRRRFSTKLRRIHMTSKLMIRNSVNLSFVRLLRVSGALSNC